MPQPAEVMAFRKRMKYHGFTDIHISACSNDSTERKWFVQAREPLARQVITIKLTLSEMYYLFKF